MPYLKLLGTPLIEGEDGPITGPAAQHHRIALLALLAVAPEHTLSRDKLMALLWPERGTKKARNSLNVSVHAIRKALGREALLSVGDDLRLDPAALECDVCRFEAALEEGDREAAVAEYGGPFLDGFHLAGSVEFGHWADGVRERLERAYARALEALAEAAEERREPSEAAEWWRRRAARDPLSARVTVRLMEALAAAGDRAAALRRARRHGERLEREFGAEPNPEVEALAARLREAPPEPNLVPDRLTPHLPETERETLPPWNGSGEWNGHAGRMVGRGTGKSGVSDASKPGQGEKEPDSSEHRAPGTGAGPRRRVGNRTAAAVGVFLGTLALGAVFWERGTAETGTGAAEAGVSNRTIAVFPFDYEGDPEYEYVGRAVAHLISTMLDGTGGLRSTDPNALSSALAQEGGEQVPGPHRAAAVARKVGAGKFVSGTVTELGGRLQLRATLYGSSLGRLAGATAVAPTEDSLFLTAEELVRRLLAEELRRTSGTFAGLAALTTRSIPALKAYLRGERLSRLGDANGATAAFREAVAHDSVFALAYYRLAISTGWGEGESLPAARKALNLADRLPPTERDLLRAVFYEYSGRHREAEGIYRRILDREPENALAWRGLASILHHYSVLTGRPPRVAESAWRRALELQPRDMWAVFEASGLAARLGRLGWLDSLIASAEALNPNERWTTIMRARRAFASDDPDEEARALVELREGGQFFEAAGRIAMQGDLRDAQRVIRLAQGPEKKPLSRGLAFLADGFIEGALGRATSARALIGRGARDLPQAALAMEASMAVASWSPAPAARLRRLRDRLRRASDEEMERADYMVPGACVRSYLLGMLAVRLGEPERAESHAGRLDSIPSDDEIGTLPRDLGASIRAHNAAESGDLDRALSRLEAMAMQVPAGLLLNSLTGGLPHARLLRADILHARGRHEEALAWYRSAGGVSLAGVLNKAPRELGIARSLDVLGYPERASEHYARVVELWERADPALKSVVREARLRLQELAGEPRPARGSSRGS